MLGYFASQQAVCVVHTFGGFDVAFDRWLSRHGWLVRKTDVLRCDQVFHRFDDSKRCLEGFEACWFDVHHMVEQSVQVVPCELSLEPVERRTKLFTMLFELNRRLLANAVED